MRSFRLPNKKYPKGFRRIFSWKEASKEIAEKNCLLSQRVFDERKTAGPILTDTYISEAIFCRGYNTGFIRDNY